MKKKFTFLLAAVMLLMMMSLPGSAVGQTKAEGDELAICQGTGSGYGVRRTLTDSHSVGWVLATGQEGYLGTGSATGHNNTHPTADDLPVVKGAYSYVYTSSTGYYFYYTTTAVANVGSLVFSYSANKGNDQATAYVVVGDAQSTSGGANYTQIALASDSQSAQGVSLGKDGTFTFTFAETQTNARYYGFVIITTQGYKRMTDGTIKLLEGSTGPTQLSTPTNFTATAGNGEATFTWDEVANASSYTISYTPAGGEEATVTGITGTSRTITGLTNGTEYTCKIKAVGNGTTYENSEFSSTITVTPAYVINITSPITGGSVTASAATATVGTTITLTATPSAGYYFNNIATNWSVAPTVTVTPGANNTATFAMPASDVTVGATFTELPVFDVTCTSPTNGTLSVTPTSGYNDVEVTITATPNSGYKLATLRATDNDGEITIANNKFNIRNSNVTVSATFDAADVYEKYTGAIVDGDYVIGYISANETEKKAMSDYYSSYTRFYAVNMSPVNNQLVDPTAKIWHIEASGDYWTIYNVTDGKYLTGTGSASQVGYEASPTPESKKLWTITVSDGLYTIKNKYNNDQNITNNFFRYGGTYWACYSTGRGSFLYRKIVNSTLTVASPSNGTITATPEGGSATAEGESLSVRNGTTITLDATGDTGYVLDAWDVYKTDDASTKVTVTNNQFTMPDYGVTVSASFRQPTTFTVQYSVNGTVVDGLTQSGIAEFSSVTLPTTGFTVPTGFAYAGWTENEVSAELIGTATYTPTDNITLYLVFVKSGQTAGYNKVTSLANITPGTYIIVSSNYCLPNTSTGSDGKPAVSDDYSVLNASSTNNYSSIPSNTEWIFTGTNSAMTIKNASGDYLYAISNNGGLRVHTTSDTWLFETYSTGFSMKETKNKRYCASSNQSDWRSYTTKDADNYLDDGILYLFRKTPVYTRVNNATTTTMDNIPATSIVTIPNGVTLTLTGTNQGDETNLIIEDGGQLITTSSNVAATVKKNIIGVGAENWAAASGAAGWYFVASPVNGASFNTATVDDYDLYMLDWAQNQWRNYKESENSSLFAGGFHRGTGYLYASKEGNTISVAGEIKPLTAADTAKVILKTTGWNLIGNPLTCKVTVDCAFSELVNASAVTNKEANSVINPCQGIAVWGKAYDEVTFTKVEPQEAAAPGNSSIQMTLAQNFVTRGNATSTMVDNAIISFNKSKGLPKFNLLESNANLYIPMDNEEYAIVSSAAQGEMPVNFRAYVTGEYTITVNPQEVEMDYLHLVDNIAGVDVDLLATPSYTFNARYDDYESRFRLVFSANMVNADLNDDFAFFSNGQLVIANEGESILQVIDVTGRVVATENINGTCSKAVNVKAGVYVLRLINGTDVKTQKVVIK